VPELLPGIITPATAPTPEAAATGLKRSVIINHPHDDNKIIIQITIIIHPIIFV
jgi:hypothetical protein